MEMKSRVPVGPGLLTGDLNNLESVRLLGTKCAECGEVTFSKYETCGNCASEEVTHVPLSDEGFLWTYTIINHCPPGQYRGAKDPFIPFGEGLVELPDGVRVLSVIDCDLEKIHIGMKLKFVAYVLYENEEGEEVVAWKFKAVE